MHQLNIKVEVFKEDDLIYTTTLTPGTSLPRKSCSLSAAAALSEAVARLGLFPHRVMGGCGDEGPVIDRYLTI